MNKNDWVMVGMRLYGLYLLVDGILNVPVLVYALNISNDALGSRGLNPGGMQITAGALTFLIGALLFLGAPAIQRWLSLKDRKGE